MKLPLGWLREYVDLSGLSPQEIANQLTMGAFEVEDIQVFGPDIKGPVVVGEILEILPHPNADKIRLTKTRVAEGNEPLEIVCGATNIAVGQKIPVALPGAQVINRKDGSPLPITRSKIRGVTSNGMLCSPSELGIKQRESDGILILDSSQSYKLGEDIKEILGLKIDHIFHIAPRSNRGDALSIIGLAREVAALFKRPLNLKQWSIEDQDDSGGFRIEIEDSGDCELFTMRALTNIRVGESPTKIIHRLESVGMRSVNNVVDITNYVMYELGQPLHAYDADKVHATLFQVRRAHSGETLTTIDGRNHQLTPEMLLITDSRTVLGVAGIMGSLSSEVSTQTTNIALEAACFNPAQVRRGSRLLGLASEASTRFERGFDLNNVISASNRAALLIKEHCLGNGPVKIGPLSQAGQNCRPERKVSVRLGEIKRILDLDLSSSEVSETLQPLGFKTIPPGQSPLPKAASASLEFLVPSFRQQDITREIDLIEEIARLYGYDRIPNAMPSNTLPAQLTNDLTTIVRETLAGQGLNEAWISSLMPAEVGEADKHTATLTQDPDTLVRVLNPLSKEHQVLRQSLLPGLLRAAVFNRDHGQKNVWLFEIGRIYNKRKDISGVSQIAGQAASQKQSDTVVHETLLVSGILTGYPLLSPWSMQNNNTKFELDFYQTKGILENVLIRLKIAPPAVRFAAAKKVPPFMHPAKAACLISVGPRWIDNGNNLKGETGQIVKLGWVGEIHPSLAKSAGLQEATYVFELNLDALQTLRKQPNFSPIFTSPKIVRDLTIDLPLSQDNMEVIEVIKSKAGEYCQAIELVSIYPLSEELKSLSYRLVFQHPEQTLKHEDVEVYLQQVRNILTEKLGASFRI